VARFNPRFLENRRRDGGPVSAASAGPWRRTTARERGSLLARAKEGYDSTLRNLEWVGPPRGRRLGTDGTFQAPISADTSFVRPSQPQRKAAPF